MFSRACLIVFMLVINGQVSFYESLFPCGLVTVGTNVELLSLCKTVSIWTSALDSSKVPTAADLQWKGTNWAKNKYKVLCRVSMGKKYPLHQIRIGGNNLISALVARTGLFRVKQHRTYHDCWQRSDLKCDSRCVSLSSVRPCQTPFAHSQGIFFMYFGCLSYEILETCERVES